MSDQIPLNLAPQPEFSFENFYEGHSNRDALKAIRSYQNWPAPVCLIMGPMGCGKTHLGRAWMRQDDNVIFIDDAENEDEMTLFSAINKALNGEVRATLLASKYLPSDWKIGLPDLQSRLRNVTLLTLFEPGEDILEPIIRKLFEDRGRAVKSDLVSYIYTHYERSVPAVSDLIRKIDLAASQAKRDVTRAFVAEYLKRS